MFDPNSFWAYRILTSAEILELGNYISGHINELPARLRDLWMQPVDLEREYFLEVGKVLLDLPHLDKLIANKPRHSIKVKFEAEIEILCENEEDAQACLHGLNFWPDSVFKFRPGVYYGLPPAPHVPYNGRLFNQHLNNIRLETEPEPTES